MHAFVSNYAFKSVHVLRSFLLIQLLMNIHNMLFIIHVYVTVLSIFCFGGMDGYSYC